MKCYGKRSILTDIKQGDIDMYLDKTEYIDKLSRIFKNVDYRQIKYAVNHFSDEREQNDFLRNLNNISSN